MWQTDRQNYDSQDCPRICSRGKNGRLEQYGAEPFEQHQFGTPGVEGVKKSYVMFSLQAYVEKYKSYPKWLIFNSCIIGSKFRHSSNSHHDDQSNLLQMM